LVRKHVLAHFLPFETAIQKILKHMKKYLAVALIALFSAILGAGAVSLFLQNQKQSTATFQLSQPTRLTAFAPSAAMPGFREAAAASTPTVVHIKTRYGAKSNADRGSDEEGFNPFKDFFGDQGFHDFFGQQGPSEGSGSGVILTQDGYIVTNNHVVENADKVEVVLFDKRTYNGKVIGTDPNTDLAVVKIEEKGLPAIQLGNSNDVQVGDWVLAVGNPFNLTSTVTAGIVSAKGRSINILSGNERVESFIQTDAAVNPGNSGGALVNTGGQLVGINSAIATQTGSYSGYSFAIPVNLMRKVVDDIVKFGAVQRGFLGVQFQEVDADLAEKENLKAIDGVYVADFSDNSAAEKAGLQKGDIITKIENEPVHSGPELQEIVSLHRPGDKLNVTVSRDGKVKDYVITLRNRDGNVGVVKNETEARSASALGADLSAPSKKELSSLSLQGGVKVNKLKKGLLSAAGVREGFIITKVDRQAVNSPKELEAALKEKSEAFIEGYYPNGQKAYYAFGM